MFIAALEDNQWMEELHMSKMVVLEKTLANATSGWATWQMLLEEVSNSNHQISFVSWSVSFKESSIVTIDGKEVKVDENDVINDDIVTVVPSFKFSKILKRNRDDAAAECFLGGFVASINGDGWLYQMLEHPLFERNLIKVLIGYLYE
jgi:hypothetical protein